MWIEVTKRKVINLDLATNITLFEGVNLMCDVMIWFGDDHSVDETFETVEEAQKYYDMLKSKLKISGSVYDD